MQRQPLIPVCGLGLVAMAMAHDLGSEDPRPHYDLSVRPPEVILFRAQTPPDTGNILPRGAAAILGLITIAILAKDNADPKTGLEYGDHIGDGGFIIKFGDGTVSNATWKAKCFCKGPLNADVKNPAGEQTPLPEKWWAVDFDDSKWSASTEFTEQQVNPKEPFYQADFAGAKFIWTDRLDLDNTVIFRTRVEKPGWKPRWTTKPDLDVSAAPLR